MCKDLLILNSPNEEDDLILETAASNEHWSMVLKIKKEKNSVTIVAEALIKLNAITLQ